MRKFLLSVLIIALLSGSAYSDEVYRVGVMRFANKAPGMSYAQAETITDMFIRMISNSKRIAVVERERLEALASEHRLAMSGLVDANTAVQIGRIAGCRYMILGSVTQLDSKQSSNSGFIPIPIFGMKVGESTHTYEANVTIDMRIVDVQTSEVLLSMAETGSAVGEQNAQSVYMRGMGSSSSSSSSSTISGIESKAVEDAVTKLGIRIREEVSGEHTQVLSAAGNEITLSVGATSGARKGGLYKVYADGAKIFDMEGNELGSKQIMLAVVEITDVQNNFSSGRVNKNWGNPSLIRRGDKIAPISSAEVKDLVKQKAFAKSRPVGSGSGVGSAELNAVNDVLRTAGVPEIPSPSSSPSQGYMKTPQASNRNSDKVNNSRDPAEIVATYDLPSGEKNARRIAHINANKLGNRSQKAYNKFVELADSYSGDYLAAFRAGEIAQAMRRRREAREWFERALNINPDYAPAKRALDRM